MSENAVKYIYLDESGKLQRACKGKSLIKFPDTYVVVDLETTGLNPQYDEIIEIAAIKVINNEIADSFQSLIKPTRKISNFITELTGITNGMLKDAPVLSSVLPAFKDFIQDLIIVGHNVNFDINFLYDNYIDLYNEPLENNFVDLLRISRKLLPDLINHKLNTLAQHFKINADDMHRGEKDCSVTNSCFVKCRHEVLKKFDSIDDFINHNSVKTVNKKILLKEIIPACKNFDETHPLYNKYCVFTGDLNKLTRTEAIQAVVNLGGFCENRVTKKTNYLITGNPEYNYKNKNKIIGKTNKVITAEKYILNDFDIKIISENTFYELLKGRNTVENKMF
ncbi:MAG: hypothetical protein K0S55_1253 [Clostridia bacterium]|nr:hypothetical protein [Clostridia bacterium]